MKKFTNEHNIHLALQVFLATDNYDKQDNSLSATSFNKSIRQLILSRRIPKEKHITDLNTLIQSRIGNAIHDGIEHAWLINKEQALLDLGYPKKTIDLMVINPSDEYLEEYPETIPIYLEQRSYKEILGVPISGKKDIIINGELNDYKTTTAYVFKKDLKARDNIIQGSIYRWLDPDKIKSNYVNINYIILDWNQYETYKEDYPVNRIVSVKYPLMSIPETEAFIKNKLNLYFKYLKAEEADIPLCTKEELWAKDPIWKYYKNSEKTNRSTKNFTKKQDAYARLVADKSVGKVVEVPGEIVACKYCSAFSICSQKDQLISQGLLKFKT